MSDRLTDQFLFLEYGKSAYHSAHSTLRPLISNTGRLLLAASARIRASRKAMRKIGILSPSARNDARKGKEL